MKIEISQLDQVGFELGFVVCPEGDMTLKFQSMSSSIEFSLATYHVLCSRS